MAGYRYLAADLRSNQVLADLSMEDASVTWTLNEAGAITGTARATVGTAADVLTATLPARTAVYVDYGGTLVAGGILWKRDYGTGQPGAYKLACAGFLSYFARRLITVLRSYQAQSQLAIVRDLIAWAQTTDGGDISLLLGAEPSVTLRTVVYDPSELRAINAEIGELAGMDGGFDWAVDVGYDSAGQPARYLRLGEPRLGVTGAAQLVEYPGNLAALGYAEDGEQMATTTWGRATAESGATITAVVSNPAAVADGYPVLEIPRSYPDVRDVARLTALVTADAAATKRPVALLSATLLGTAEPHIGDFQVGDSMRVRATEPWRFPAAAPDRPGLDTTLRLIAATARPRPDATGGSVVLTFGDVIA